MITWMVHVCKNRCLMINKGQRNILFELLYCNSDSPVELFGAYSKNSFSKKASSPIINLQVLSIDFLRTKDRVNTINNEKPFFKLMKTNYKQTTDYSLLLLLLLLLTVLW